MKKRQQILALGTTLALSAGVLSPVAHAAETDIPTSVGGTVEWNFKDSFMSYVTSNFAKGTVTVTEGATWEEGKPFTFPVDSENSVITDTDTAIIDLDGTVNFNAHGGILNTTISDLKLHVDGNVGSLYIDYSSKPMSLEPGESAVIADDIHFVDIIFAEPVDLTAPLQLSGATTLAPAGVPVLSNYPAGDSFSDLTLNLDVEFGDEDNPDEIPVEDDDSADNNLSSANGGGGFSSIFESISAVLGIGALAAVVFAIAQHLGKLMG